MPASSESTPDLALVGAGDWGKRLGRCFDKLRALRSVVVPPEAEQEQELRTRFPGVRVETELAAVLRDPAIDKLAIATPSASHFELAKAALAAGKHVFVEKPLCLSAPDAEELVRLAERVSRTLMVGHLLQYHPCAVKLRELVAGGELGRILTITSTRLNLGKFRKDENSLYSFAPHDVSLVLSLLGDRLPAAVRCVGASYLNPGVADSTLTLLQFDDGALAHLHVSWLNPFKEQRLTVVGTQGMAVFDDTRPWGEKLSICRNYISWPRGADPIARAPEYQYVVAPEVEPLFAECQHFLEACREGRTPLTDGREGVRVLSVLDMAQRSLEQDGERATAEPGKNYFAHPTAVIDSTAVIGDGSRIWHFCHVMDGARIGKRCTLGQNVNVAGGALVGDDVKVQNNVSIYAGVELEDDVFLGPSCVFTNVKNPRAAISRRGEFEKTRVRRGATLGANCTVVCGVELGRYCFVAAGAVVTRDVPDYALMVGNPARRTGWVGRHGKKLVPGVDGELRCPESGLRYREVAPGRLRCLELDELEPGG